jgi:hypothetical protein
VRVSIGASVTSFRRNRWTTESEIMSNVCVGLWRTHFDVLDRVLGRFMRRKSWCAEESSPCLWRPPPSTTSSSLTAVVLGRLDGHDV